MQGIHLPAGAFTKRRQCRIEHVLAQAHDYVYVNVNVPVPVRVRENVRGQVLSLAADGENEQGDEDPRERGAAR